MNSFSEQNYGVVLFFNGEKSRLFHLHYTFTCFDLFLKIVSVNIAIVSFVSIFQKKLPKPYVKKKMYFSRSSTDPLNYITRNICMNTSIYRRIKS